jgi:flagellar FliL protein
MAEEKEKKEAEQAEEPQGKGFPMKLVVFALLAVVLLGGGFFAWQKGLLGGDSGDSEGEAVAAKKAESKAGPEIGPIYPLNTFIVNLNEPLGKRYLKAKVELELDGEEVQMEIDKRLPQFRDAILTMLSSKSYGDVSDLSGKYQLRAEIISILNGYLHSGKVANVYFTEFIVQ